MVLGHSERREHFGETDRALALKVPAALAAGLTPILCVGETEAERDNDDTDRKLRQQVKDDLAGVPSERLSEVVIAYEPIWAIGTGRVATAEQAQEAIAFIRALVGDRDEQAAEAVRILYGGSVKPENAAELLGARGRRRRARRAELAAGGVVRARSSPPRVRMSVPPARRTCPRRARAWSCSTDGGSPSPVPATPSRSRARRCSTSCGPSYPHTTLQRLRPGGGAARGADGQLRGRPSEPRGRSGRTPGPRAHRRRDRRRVAGRERGPQRAAFAAERGRRPAARVHLLGLVSDGGVHSSLEHLRALIAMARALEVEDLVLHAFTDGRDTLPHAGAGYLAELDAHARRAAWGRWSGATGRWTATGAGIGPSGPTTCSCTAARRTTRPRGEQAVSEAYERGETDEFIEPTLVGEEATIRPGDSVIAFNFRPDRMRQLTRALAEPAFGTGAGAGARPGGASRLDRARGRAAGRALRDVHRVRGGLALSGRVRARAPADDALGGAAHAPAPRSCTWPRPRSTRTSPTSSTAARRPRSQGERRELVASPRDVPTYDHKPADERARGRRRVRGRLAGGSAPGSRSSTSRTPTWSGTPA